jgi:hypothetical protein
MSWEPVERFQNACCQLSVPVTTRLIDRLDCGIALGGDQIVLCGLTKPIRAACFVMIIGRMMLVILLLRIALSQKPSVARMLITAIKCSLGDLLSLQRLTVLVLLNIHNFWRKSFLPAE